MNTRSFIKSKAHIVSSTLFFIGIVLSAEALYVLPVQPAVVTLQHVYVIIGITFFAGLISIHFTARTIKQTVVYLEPKKTDQKQTVIIHSGSQLEAGAIEKIVQGGNSHSQRAINELCKQLKAGQAALYAVHQTKLELTCGFALSYDNNLKQVFEFGEGLIGRVAKEGNSLYIDKLPDGYITIFSGLGSASPPYLVIVPLKSGDEVKGVLEIALFHPLTKETLLQLETIGNTWAKAGL